MIYLSVFFANATRKQAISNHPAIRAIIPHIEYSPVMGSVLGLLVITNTLKRNCGGAPRCKQTGHPRLKPKLNTHALYPNRSKLRGIQFKINLRGD
jgi:hypothetical protein